MVLMKCIWYDPILLGVCVSVICKIVCSTFCEYIS
jgi:hypothetical protein